MQLDEPKQEQELQGVTTTTNTPEQENVQTTLYATKTSEQEEDERAFAESQDVPKPKKEGKTTKKRVNLKDGEEGQVADLKKCMIPIIDLLESEIANETLDEYGTQVRNSAVQLLINSTRQLDNLASYVLKLQAKKAIEENDGVMTFLPLDHEEQVAELGEKGADSIITDTV